MVKSKKCVVRVFSQIKHPTEYRDVHSCQYSLFDLSFFKFSFNFGDFHVVSAIVVRTKFVVYIHEGFAPMGN